MKKVLISGSSSGIGRAIAEMFLSHDWQVVGLARDHQKFQPDSPCYDTHAIDLSKTNTLERELKAIANVHPQLDCLVLSAGVGMFGACEQLSFQDMQTVMDVNFLSQALMVKTWLPQFKKAGGGHIIFIGSEAALSGERQGSAYCASKFALRGFSQSLRKECARANVAVTLINPGFVDTPFFDDLDFAPEDPSVHAIAPQSIADCVWQVVGMAAPCVVEEINLQPMTKGIKKKS
jgi:short-subunit dehydrogenase